MSARNADISSSIEEDEGKSALLSGVAILR